MFRTYEQFKKNILLFSKYCTFENDILTCLISNIKYKVCKEDGFIFCLIKEDNYTKIYPGHIIDIILPEKYPLNSYYTLDIDYFVMANTFVYNIICPKPYIKFTLHDTIAINITDDILFNKLSPEILLDYLCEKSLPFRQVMACSELLKEDFSICI